MVLPVTIHIVAVWLTTEVAMPACFQLYRKTDTAAGPVKFSTIDDELCAHLGVPVHPTNYHCGWYSSIGLGLAMGNSWDRLREIFSDDSHQLAIINWMDANFTPNSWYEGR
jgi:hypothetical protein